ncbi:MAG: hypothetical protein WCG45_00900 [bacterium]
MSNFPQSVRVWYYVEVRDDAGLWVRLKGSFGESVCTQSIIEKPNTFFGINFGTYKDFSEHDVANARKTILEKAKGISLKYKDVKIMRRMFDDTGYGEERLGKIWQNGNWLD